MGAYTLTHLYQIAPTLLFCVLLSAVAARTLGKYQRDKKYIPLKVIAALLVLLEIAKQINAATGEGGYDLYALPFHYCSLFLYLLPLHAFYRGKHKRAVGAVTFTCLASLLLLLLLIPAVIYSEESIRNFFSDFADFHTVIFHSLAVLYFMLTVALGCYAFDTKRDLFTVSAFLAAYVAVATVLAYTLKVNFHNLYRCNIAFIEEFRLAAIGKIGVWGTVFYVGGLFALTILFGHAAYALARGVIGVINGHEKGSHQ